MIVLFILLMVFVGLPIIFCYNYGRSVSQCAAWTIKQSRNLAKYGVRDPDLEWGRYVLLRPWDEKRFLASKEVFGFAWSRSADATHRAES
jgi:hypothetical protein